MWNFEEYINNSAIIDEFGNCVTYRELSDVGKLITDCINQRCIVFCLCENSIGSIMGYVAFVNNGIVPVMLNSNLEGELLHALFNTYKPSYIWMPQGKMNEFERVDVVYSYSGYVLVRCVEFDAYEIDEELCLLLTTSGSTGSPKFVRQSYKNVFSNAKSIVEYLGLTASECPITTLPMNYTYGLSIINSHLMVGATLLVTDKGIMQKEFWRFFKEGKATSFGGVPYTYEMLDRLRFYRMDLPSLRYMTQAGGKLSVELHKKFAEYALSTGRQFVVMYGQCEATARMGYLPAEKSLEKCGSMGIAIPGGTFELVDSEGNRICEANVTGELIYAGDNVTLGYAECCEDLKKGDENHGILHTGDIAQRDTDGFYYIVGRKKRFLKIYGNRVNLDEIEQLIKVHFGSVEVVCSGKDDHLYIFTTDSSIAEDVRKFAIKKTKLNPSAFKTVIIDKIPKNDSGKILYKKLDIYYDKE